VVHATPRRAASQRAVRASSAVALTGPLPDRPDDAARDVAGGLSLRALLVVFLKAGFAWGGGLGILAVLEDELVRRHRVLTEDEFLAMYGVGRIVPSGTMTALAVAFGHRLGGWPGTVVALLALSLPAFVLVAILTAGYATLRGGALLEVLPVTILPAAVALVVLAGARLGRRYMKLTGELLIVVGAFAGSLLLGINPAVLLLLGGVTSMGLARWRRGRAPA
jgi:chromate transporter